MLTRRIYVDSTEHWAERTGSNRPGTDYGTGYSWDDRRRAIDGARLARSLGSLSAAIVRQAMRGAAIARHAVRRSQTDLGAISDACHSKETPPATVWLRLIRDKNDLSTGRHSYVLRRR